MKKTYIFYFILMFTVTHNMLIAQEVTISNCLDTVRTSYQKNVGKCEIEKFTIFLNSGFDENGIIHLNDSILYSGPIITNLVLSNALTLNVDAISDTQQEVNLVLSKRCLNIPLNANYKYITISWWKNSWYVFYTNKKPIFE